jgi:hypothetical protein
MSYENDLIKKITGAIGSIKRKEVSIKDAKVGIFLNKLKEVNIGQYDELLKTYKDAIK